MNGMSREVLLRCERQLSIFPGSCGGGVARARVGQLWKERFTSAPLFTCYNVLGDECLCLVLFAKKCKPSGGSHITNTPLKFGCLEHSKSCISHSHLGYL